MPLPTHPFDDSIITPPECAPTVARVQAALDGTVTPEALAADPHLSQCADCRARAHGMRLLLATLAAPKPAVAVPAGFADRVLAALAADRPAPAARRFPKVAALLALAAAVLLGVWFIARPTPPADQKPAEVVKQPAPAPAPEPPEVAPAPRAKALPVRIGAEVAKAGQAILDAPKPITDSVAVAPKLFDALAGTFKLPAPPDPMVNVELPSLPVAARASLEPVTGTAEKAFNRFLRDVGAVRN
jgi:hypothetical protein